MGRDIALANKNETETLPQFDSYLVMVLQQIERFFFKVIEIQHEPIPFYTGIKFGELDKKLCQGMDEVCAEVIFVRIPERLQLLR